jgi:hypothetical protein
MAGPPAFQAGFRGCGRPMSRFDDAAFPAGRIGAAGCSHETVHRRRPKSHRVSEILAQPFDKIEFSSSARIRPRSHKRNYLLRSRDLSTSSADGRVPSSH